MSQWDSSLISLNPFKQLPSVTLASTNFVYLLLNINSIVLEDELMEFMVLPEQCDAKHGNPAQAF